MAVKAKIVQHLRPENSEDHRWVDIEFIDDTVGLLMTIHEVPRVDAMSVIEKGLEFANTGFGVFAIRE